MTCFHQYSMDSWKMFKRSAAVCAFALLAFSAPAETVEEAVKSNCDSRETVLAFLSDRYAEAPVAMGVARNGGLVEVLTSGAGGSTFTIIVTTPDGRTCMVAAGDGWESLPPLAPNTRI
jgi:thymidylate kinase